MVILKIAFQIVYNVSGDSMYSAYPAKAGTVFSVLRKTCYFVVDCVNWYVFICRIYQQWPRSIIYYNPSFSPGNARPSLMESATLR